MLLVDERCLQPDLVGADRIVPIASVAASRDLDASHQLNVLRRKSPQRLTFSSIDRTRQAMVGDLLLAAAADRKLAL
jgi:hypothetical protein